ncbi:hypothetical protein FIBSPDRAFT_1038803 [Athelia psychrophila]|uniref:Uncharacterized protein n=1 Tax=Athelia psychrophila TaxID=1759441 RepID=A0A166SFG0_9AGAM|nr:hypothetical protein FIBSPDRAFT_1038803 [Fibularhizoctonia sp. CBS 109695]
MRMDSSLASIIYNLEANQTSKYIFVAQFVVSTFTLLTDNHPLKGLNQWYTWDWLLSISEEYEVVSKAGLSFSTTIYFVSRISAFGQMFCFMLFRVAAVPGCAPLFAMSATCAFLATVCTSFLFFIRVRAVYLKSRLITFAFGAVWIMTIAVNLIQYSAVHAGHIPGTEFCMASSSKNLAGLPSIANAVNDTLVFLAISYRLASNAATEDSWRARLQSIIKTRGLYSVSSSLMRSGQLYYFATILGFSANFIIMYSSVVPVDYRSMLLVMVYALANITACHVFRGVALGTMASQNTPSGFGNTMIAAALELDPLPAHQISKVDQA